MARQFISPRNLRFLLYEIFDAPSLARHERFTAHDRDSIEMVLDTALRLANDLLLPAFHEMDQRPPRMVDGAVQVHPVVRKLLDELGRGGWLSAPFSLDHGGQEMPLTVYTAFRFILAAANYSAVVFPSLTTGAAHLILSYGSKELIETYARKMLAGDWQGTMAMTEPNAGSSLADLTTQAEPAADGSYRIRGQKIFITAAEHDAVDNVVHLLLAKIKGAPLGIKGVSMFVVPQKRVAADGRLVDNDVSCVALYHKLGYKGAPLTQLSLGDGGDCHGFLVGEPHRGIIYMFQMMNEARIDVGMGATAIATAAYHASLQYTRERLQGRPINERDLATPQVPIIEHADVKRMLLFQRAVVEGSLALVLQLATYADRLAVTDGEDRERCQLLLDLLTPVAKTYPSEMGILSVSQGLQCLGGYGFCDEFPLEQLYRDIRIHPIHEGTTAIQAMDLLGRKVVAEQGKAPQVFLAEVGRDIEEAKAFPSLIHQAEALQQATKLLTQVTTHLIGLAMKGEIERFLADATLYLELFGIGTIAWQWLKQATVATRALAANPRGASAGFYQGKLITSRYFFEYELPKIGGLAQRLQSADPVTVEARAHHFDEDWAGDLGIAPEALVAAEPAAAPARRERRAEYTTILYEEKSRIGLLTLNRPKALNALNLTMIEELEHLFDQLGEDGAATVLILTGAGDKGFCSGLDMKETAVSMFGQPLDKIYLMQARTARLYQRMRALPQPIIAAVHGAAAGAGFSFAMASDVRVISDQARFNAAYINIGLGGADLASSYFLPKLIGTGRANEFLYTGGFMSALEAKELGFASRMVPQEKLLDTAYEIARQMTSKNPFGLRLTKEAINQNLGVTSLEQALHLENRNQAFLIAMMKAQGT